MADNLPIKPLPIVERWDCHNCGNCCRGSIVRLDDADLKRLREQHWERHPDYAGIRVFVRQGWIGGGYRLAHREDGSCVFLTEDGLCRIHKEFGFDEKPIICRTFPLQLVPLGRFAYLTTRRSCPSAACDKGRNINEQRATVNRLIKAGRGAPLACKPPRLTRRRQSNWKDLLAVAAVFERLLADTRFPIVRRFVHGLQFCDLFEQCKLKALDNNRLSELAQMLESSCLEDAGQWFRNRQPPGRSATTLFRQTASEYVRLHPYFRAAASWRTRLRFVGAAFSFARGKGTVPAIHAGFSPTTFESLERPLGPLEESIRTPLDTYFTNSATSKQYAILGRDKWSLIDSFRSFAITFPIALWMMRLATGDQDPKKEDMLDVLTAIDRAQGYAPLTGRRHRQRVATIAELGELPRLVAWYAR